MAGDTALGEFYEGVLNNRVGQVKRAVEALRIDPNARFTQARKRQHRDLCAVHLAAFRGHIELLHYLISAGCDVNRVTATLRRQPLHYAALRHQMACALMLINAGALVNSRDTFGNTALHYAAEDGNVTLIGLLVARGANVDVADITNKTPLMKAVRSNAPSRIAAVRKLLSCGANVALKDKHDDTSLHFGARQGNVQVTRGLLLAGASGLLDAQNQFGLTALMEACSYNQRDVVQLLVRARCDLYKRDFRNGETALHIAVRRFNVQIVETLLDAGAWLARYSYTSSGESFLWDVLVYNRTDLLRLFIVHNYEFDYVARRVLVLPATAAAHAAHSTTERSPPTAVFSGRGPLDPSDPSLPQYGDAVVCLTCSKHPFQLALERGHYEMAYALARIACYSARNLYPLYSIPVPVPVPIQGPATGPGPGSASNPVPGLPSNEPASTSSGPVVVVPVVPVPAVVPWPMWSSPRNERLREELEEVPPLKRWCRRAIRQAMGFQLPRHLDQLPLPPCLRRYVLGASACDPFAE